MKSSFNIISDMSVTVNEITADSHINALNKHFNNRYRVYDADVCGNFNHYFGVRNSDTGEEKYYELIYSWYIEYDPHWELVDSLEINEISKEYTKNLHGFRDWMHVY